MGTLKKFLKHFQVSKIKDSIQLAPGLEISRIITGLWQIADMERGGIDLDVEDTSKSMCEYYDNGFTSFRYGRSLWL